MNKKGLTVIELIVTFSLTVVIALLLVQVIVSLKNLYDNNAVKLEIVNVQSLLSNQINNKFNEIDIMSVNECGTNCMEFYYEDGSIDTLSLNDNRIAFGEYTKGLPNDTYFGDFIVDITYVPTFDETSDNGILNVKIPIKSNKFPDETFDINVFHQFNRFIAIDTISKDEIDEPYREELLNGADPEIYDGLIPVNISNNGKVTKADITKEWYSYADKKWANAVLVTDENREIYKEADPGILINQEDITAYYVWIPRYRYQLFNVSGSSISSQQIDIIFENKLLAKSTGTVNGEYLTHPAFTFGSSELNGIWVGKFEMTGTKDFPTILPNNDSMNGSTSTMFTASQRYRILYGLSIDSHMIKNSDWGAIAYLTNSIYGRCTDGVCEEVRINNYLRNNQSLTGCGASSDNEAQNYLSCSIAYGSSSEYPQSTTKNISGVFDMSGGHAEYVMGILADNVGNPLSGRHNVWNSGFNGNFGCPSCVETDGSDSTLLSGGDSTITSLTEEIDFPISKYYNLYTNRTDKTLYLGDAMWETSAWNNDNFVFVSSSNPWFVRGGFSTIETRAGIFNIYPFDGRSHVHYTSRSVLVKE